MIWLILILWILTWFVTYSVMVSRRIDNLIKRVDGFNVETAYSGIFIDRARGIFANINKPGEISFHRGQDIVDISIRNERVDKDTEKYYVTVAVQNAGPLTIECSTGRESDICKGELIAIKEKESNGLVPPDAIHYDRFEQIIKSMMYSLAGVTVISLLFSSPKFIGSSNSNGNEASQGNSQNTTMASDYKGVSINSKWGAQSTCQTARYMIKRDNYSLTENQLRSLYNLPCTVSKLTQPLIGKYSRYQAYAVSWPNGVAARVFVTPEGLRMMGRSNDGIPSDW